MNRDLEMKIRTFTEIVSYVIFVLVVIYEKLEPIHHSYGDRLWF